MNTTVPLNDTLFLALKAVCYANDCARYFSHDKARLISDAAAAQCRIILDSTGVAPMADLPDPVRFSAEGGVEALRSCGKSLTEIGNALGVTRGAISQWTKIPAERVGEIAIITGIPPQALRPDLFLFTPDLKKVSS